MKKKTEVKIEEIELMELLQTLAFLYLDNHPYATKFENVKTGKIYTPSQIRKMSNKMIDILRTHLNLEN